MSKGGGTGRVVYASSCSFALVSFLGQPPLGHKSQTFETSSLHAPYLSRSPLKKLGHCYLFWWKKRPQNWFSRSELFSIFYKPQIFETTCTSLYCFIRPRSPTTKPGHYDLCFPLLILNAVYSVLLNNSNGNKCILKVATCLYFFLLTGTTDSTHN